MGHRRQVVVAPAQAVVARARVAAAPARELAVPARVVAVPVWEVAAPARVVAVPAGGRCFYRGGVETAELLAAKLRAPVPLSPLLPRPRIDDLLESAVRDSVLVLLVGPGGSGKTAALTQWSATRAVPPAWITLDQQDNDPARFWPYVASSLGLGGLPFQPGSDAFVAALAEGIQALDERPVLVLDEFEHLVTERVHRQLDLLIHACGNDVTVVAAGRVRPQLRTDRLELARRLTVLTWDDLSFSPAEATKLLSTLGSPPASGKAVDRLTTEADGWPGGLVLGGAKLTDYLLDYVWAGLAPPLREFLLESAVPSRFDVALMNAVRGRNDSAELIDRLRRDAVLLISDDGAGRWYRYQRQFREALLHRLETTEPDRATIVRRAAARWHARSGDEEEAIALALAAGEYRLAVQLVDELLDPLYRAGRLVSLDQWLSALPDSELGSALAGRALNLWCELGRFSERDRQISLAPGHRGIGPDEVWRLCLPRERGDLTLALRQGRALVTGSLLTSPHTASQARISLARSLLIAGQLDECRELAREIPALWESDPPAPIRAASAGITGLVDHLRGRSREAATRATEVRAALHQCGIQPTARMMPEASLLLALQADEPAYELAQLVGEPGFGSDLTMGAFAALLLARHSSGAVAREHLAAADELLSRCPNPLGLVELRDQVAAEVGEPDFPARTRPDGTLSERELLVLQYLRSELTLREIAADLFLSLNTVKTHARNVYRKLGVIGRRELTR